MRIDLDDRLDKQYPEHEECEVNERDCEYTVDHVCHECGAPMCDACAIGIRHQPRLSLYTYETFNGTERLQEHCPECMEKHTLSGRNLGLGGGMGLIGVLLAYLGGVDSIPMTLVGLLLLVGGILIIRHEYWLKVRYNDNYGLTSMF